MTEKLQRRQVLAGIGTLGALGATGTSLGWGGRRHGYTHYTYAQTIDDTDDSILQVAWYETYNGQVQETHGTTNSSVTETLDPIADPQYVADATGPIISLTGVMPGDEGSLMIGVAAVEEGTRVWFRPTVDTTRENGRNEPERSAGDTTDTEGELQDAVGVRLWKDSGAFDSGVGACDGRLFGDLEYTDERTALGTVGSQFTDGIIVADCLAPDASVCIGLNWELPVDTDNQIQTDGVDFTLDFVGVPCSEDCNPFTSDCEGESP